MMTWALGIFSHLFSTLSNSPKIEVTIFCVLSRELELDIYITTTLYPMQCLIHYLLSKTDSIWGHCAHAIENIQDSDLAILWIMRIVSCAGRRLINPAQNLSSIQ